MPRIVTGVPKDEDEVYARSRQALQPILDECASDSPVLRFRNNRQWRQDRNRDLRKRSIHPCVGKQDVSHRLTVFDGQQGQTWTRRRVHQQLLYQAGNRRAFTRAKGLPLDA